MFNLCASAYTAMVEVGDRYSREELCASHWTVVSSVSIEKLHMSWQQLQLSAKLDEVRLELPS